MGFGPAQVHSEQHFRPVLRFGATGAGLDVEEGITGVEFAREHATKLQRGDLLLIRGQVR